MERYKKILVAIDGSETSLHALKESFKLVQEQGNSITVVAVVPPYTGDLELVGIGSGNIQDFIRKPYEDAISQSEELARSQGVSIKTVCEEGEAYKRIIELAEAEDSHLIVMARRGRRSLARVLVGSTTSRVIGYTQRDVLVIPKTADLGWKNILLATDGSKCSQSATEKAIAFSKLYEGELKVVSVVDVPTEFYGVSSQVVENLIKKAQGFVDEVQKKAEPFGIKVSTFVGEGDAYQMITNLAKNEMADIIFMGSHGRTGLKRLLMGSVTEEVIGHTNCPVLVVKKDMVIGN